MSNRPTWRDSINATSSPELGDGRWLSDWSASPMIGLLGLVPALANLSARQAKERGLLTSGTYGRPGIGSSNSAALSASLGSKLTRRLAATGSTLFLLTWKVSATASGRVYSLLRASAPRKRDTDVISWPTPKTSDSSGGGQARRTGAQRSNLVDDVMLAAWPTSIATDAASGARHGYAAGHPGTTLLDAALLAAWPAPVRADGDGSRIGRGASVTGKRPDGSKTNVSLNSVAQAAHWTAPTASDWRNARETEREVKMGKNLSDSVVHLMPVTGAARLLDSGEMLTGCDAAMTNGGQLSPDHSRWLMGYPIEWRNCAVTGTRSFRAKQRRSLKATSTF